MTSGTAPGKTEGTEHDTGAQSSANTGQPGQVTPSPVESTQEAQAARQGYDVSQFERPSVTVDVVVLTVRAQRLDVLLVRRRHWPDAGKWAIPGGFVNPNEPLEDAARRELQEETGARDVVPYQFQSFGDPGRDPRGWVVTVAHLALVSEAELSAQQIAGADDAAEAGWFDAYAPPPLAFDHAKILDCALAEVRTKLDCMPLASALLPASFTMGQLQGVYEALLHRRFPVTTFARKMRASGLLERAPVAGQTAGRGGQTLYRFKAPVEAQRDGIA